MSGPTGAAGRGRSLSLSLPLEFVASYPDPLQPLDPPLPEIAFLGRSNVGKSSLLNALAGKKALARVSASPGKTELLNVYRVSRLPVSTAVLPTCRPADLYLLDLPGYGFARHSKTARAGFRKLLEAVVSRRTSLTGFVWLLDVRHPPSEDDLRMQELLIDAARPVLAVLTKVDKLSRAQRAKAHRDRSRELGLSETELLLTSSTTGLGIVELRESILAAARIS